MSSEIKDFETLISPVLRNGQKFVSYKCKNLLNSGENYGSVILQVDVAILNEDGKTEVIHCVAKTCPPPGMVWEMFQIKLTFKTEIALYKEIVPALAEFAKEKGCENLTFFAKCLEARISANPKSDDVDEDAVLLMENLNVQGYGIGDRFTGFDKDTAMLLLNDLAIMHATPIAYKKAKPEEFQRKILPHLMRKNKMETADLLSDVTKFATKIVMSNSDCAPHSFQIEKALRQLTSQSNSLKRNELFTTLVHHDYWVNNTMVKYENGKPVSNKIVDFQGINYDSFANDLAFFLYSSVELSVLQDHLDELYKFYYGKFIETLVKLQCDISEYTFEALMEECGTITKEMQFGHLIFLLVPILRLKGQAVDLNGDLGGFCKEDTIHENYGKRIQFILLDLIKRKWI